MGENTENMNNWIRARAGRQQTVQTDEQPPAAKGNAGSGTARPPKQPATMNDWIRGRLR